MRDCDDDLRNVYFSRRPRFATVQVGASMPHSLRSDPLIARASVASGTPPYNLEPPSLPV